MTGTQSLFSVHELQSHEIETWNSLVEKSDEGTIFHRHDFLKSARGEKFKCFFVKKGTHIKAGITVLESGLGAVEEDDFVIHSGLFFLPPDSRDGTNRQKYLTDRFQLTEEYVRFMSSHYNKIDVTLPPGFEDVRPFLWHNYGDVGADTFKIDVRYTTKLRLADFTFQNDDYFSELSSSRRQEIRYARKDNVSAKLSDDVSGFIDLYLLTMQKSQVNARDKTATMERIMMDLLKRKQGALFAVTDSTGLMLSGSFWAWDSKRAYYLYGGNHPDNKDRYSGSIVLWDAITHFKKEGIEELDLEGVNSPKRGWFKLSFGGNLSPYYQVKLGV